jgi:hypothetical protein
VGELADGLRLRVDAVAGERAVDSVRLDPFDEAEAKPELVVEEIL